MKNLVIVESPAKAKTIEKYLGSDFTVLSSVGHIRSIAKKTKTGVPPIDIKNGYATTYEIDSDKKKTITELKKAVKVADTVWLATDEDREGEAIAWHLCEVLKLDIANTKRIVFHEITKTAIQEAIKNPRTINIDLVKAQQARQILDRIVGFELSPVVWQKVPGGKSAGRVQSPAVRLLVEREHEIRAYDGVSQFKVTALFTANNEEIKAELSEKFATEKEAQEFLESLSGGDFTVTAIKKTPGVRNPAAPFTTSTLQQEANSKLGMSSKATMSSAQKLYQEGKITYMRTDSVNLSGQAIAAAADFIKRLYGSNYSVVRKYKTKNNNAQEAHEAIRPTDITREAVGGNSYDQKLYDLIRNRTLASQMSPAKIERTEITISSPVKTLVFIAKGEVVLFDGFLRVYGSKKDEILPMLADSDTLQLTQAEARQTFSRPPARYSEGSLVKKLEELGIGRPSTYATIINTVQVRGYAEKGDSEGKPRDVIVLRRYNDCVDREVIQEKTGSTKGKLVPTPAGELIADFLTNYFKQVVDYGFTANVEKEFDQIATGDMERNTMLDEFYTPFHDLIEKSGDIDRSSVAKSREIGIDPKSKKPVLARMGRYGPMLQLGSTDSDEKPQFAPLPKGTELHSITLEQALPAFQLPRIVGKTEDDQEIKANIGRFGPYIQVGKLFVSLKEDDPHTINEAKARQLYMEKLAAEAAKLIAEFDDGIKIIKGHWGPYITNGKKNAKIPKETDPTSITQEQATELLEKAPARGAKRNSRSTKKSKK